VADQLFLSGFFLTGHCFTLSFSCTAVGFGALTTNRKTFSMAKTAVASNIKQSLDAHRNLTSKGSFYFEFCIDDVTNSSLLIIIPLVYFFVVIDSSFVQNVLGSRATDAKNIGQSNFPSFIFREIDTGDTSHINYFVGG